jgi:hypothetical protein
LFEDAVFTPCDLSLCQLGQKEGSEDDKKDSANHDAATFWACNMQWRSNGRMKGKYRMPARTFQSAFHGRLGSSAKRILRQPSYDFILNLHHERKGRVVIIFDHTI